MGKSQIARMPSVLNFEGVWDPETGPELVEHGEIVNLDVWDKMYVTAGCKSARDKRRADKALGLAYEGLKVPDRQVVALLGNLAAMSSNTPVRKEIRELVKEFKTCCGGNYKTPLKPDTPEWEVLRKILKVSVLPSAYGPDQVDEYRSDIQLTKLLSKYPFDGASEAAEITAIEKLLRQEQKNALTNHLWTLGNFDPDQLDLIERVHDELEEILGVPPQPEEILSNAAWGPGTTVGYPYGPSETGSELKFGHKLTCTPSLTSVAPWVVTYYPEWAASMASMNHHEWFSVVPGDKLFTVPKKFEEARCAMTQPDVNIWLTRGVGVTIRNRLSQAGLDIQKQQYKNKELACIGSGTGIFCTLDLTSASDSNCRAVLRSVLNPAWFAWLYSTASRKFTLPTSYTATASAKAIDYEMMSSMGCGYTFELETALFYAIARAIVPASLSFKSTKGGQRIVRDYSHIGVYGDDIIVPTAYAERVIEALSLFGFSVNVAKSHYQPGPGFRESCGGDYLYGVAVRPLYITSRLDNGFAITTTANRIVEHAIGVRSLRIAANRSYGHRAYCSLHNQLVGFIPRILRVLIATPRSTDFGLWTEEDFVPMEFTGQPDRYRCYVRTPVKRDLAIHIFCEDGVWLGPCNGANLLAARLNVGIGDPEENVDKWAEVSVGTGNHSICRGKTRTAIGYASRHGESLWRGWS